MWEADCQCVHYACVYWMYVLLVRDSEIPTNPSNWRQHTCGFINSFASLSTSQLQHQFSRSLGVWASVRFQLDSSRLHILSVNSIWTVCEFNNEMCFWENFRGSYNNIRKTDEYQSNAETFDHLALLAMLSALRHGWGIYALCCGKIERYLWS